jgi:diaminopimelate decarboxylase
VTAFPRVGGELHAEDVPLSALAERFGTPCYVYSRAALESGFRTFSAAFDGVPHLVCYAVKANSNLAVLNILARLGSGFDIVSGGELARVIAAGGDPAKIVFSGVGKTPLEMEAALAVGIRCFNVESAAELETLDAIARGAGKIAPISLRVNPDVDPKTHPYIATGLKESKFGVAFDDALGLYRRAAELPGVAVHGIDCHIGSQITELAACAEAAGKMFELVDRLEAEGIALRHVDLGGGLGIRYHDEETIDPYAFALAVRRARGARDHELLFEPGRFLVGNAGVLLTRVLYLKPGAGAQLRDRRCRDERPPPSRALCCLARHRRGAPARRGGAPLGDRRTGVRERRFPRARPPAGIGRRRSPRRARCGRVRVRDELQLQLAPACVRGRRRRRPHASRPSARGCDDLFARESVLP